MGKQKVITVKGDRTKWYDKVIFVVKNENVKENIDLLVEAEKIVSEYMLTNSMPYTNKTIKRSLDNSHKVSKKGNKIDKFLYFAIGFAIFTLVYLMIV